MFPDNFSDTHMATAQSHLGTFRIHVERCHTTHIHRDVPSDWHYNILHTYPTQLKKKQLYFTKKNVNSQVKFPVKLSREDIILFLSCKSENWISLQWEEFEASFVPNRRKRRWTKAEVPSALPLCGRCRETSVNGVALKCWRRGHTGFRQALVDVTRCLASLLLVVPQSRSR